MIHVKRTEGIASARMAFDLETLRPLYRLEMGKTGKSCALEIASRMGFPSTLLAYAREIAERGLPDTPCKGFSLPQKSGRLRPISTQPTLRSPVSNFVMGDSVRVFPEKEQGIVYRPEDEKGVVVQVKGQKRAVRHDRIRLLVSASELYPPDYDFSILFDTVENRKARHVLSKRYDAEATIHYESEIK